MPIVDLDLVREIARVMHEEGLARFDVAGMSFVLGQRPAPAMQHEEPKPRDLDKEIDESPDFADWREGRLPTGGFA
jgi:hypothetical protein